MSGTERDSRQRFDHLLLGGLIVLIGAGVAIALTLYLLPDDHLQLEELQPFARVAREAEFLVGASRVVSWGDHIILVVRGGEQEYFGLEGVSPTDGCILNWDAESLRVVSPCTYMVYDLRGNVVAGLTTTPLRPYSVYVRDGVIYVTA